MRKKRRIENKTERNWLISVNYLVKRRIKGLIIGGKFIYLQAKFIKLDMPAFLKKAQNNIATAELLIDNGLPLTSAHPAYYSSFLLMKYLLAHFFSVSYAQQEEMTKNKDSHKMLANKALPCMAIQDTETGNDYLVWYNKLKMLRRKADYKPVDIEDSLLTENLTTAKDFMKSVDSHFISVKK